MSEDWYWGFAAGLIVGAVAITIAAIARERQLYGRDPNRPN
jgi:hypothetical protein